MIVSVIVWFFPIRLVLFLKYTPERYSKLGFLQADIYGIKCEIEVPAEAFLVRELRVGALKSIKGIVRYNPKFNEL